MYHPQYVNVCNSQQQSSFIVSCFWSISNMHEFNEDDMMSNSDTNNNFSTYQVRLLADHQYELVSTNSIVGLILVRKKD